MFNTAQVVTDLSEYSINDLGDINSSGTEYEELATTSLWQIYFPYPNQAVEIQINDSGTIDGVILGNIATWQYSTDGGDNFNTPGSYTAPNLAVTAADLIQIKVLTFTSGSSGTITINETKS